MWGSFLFGSGEHANVVGWNSIKLTPCGGYNDVGMPLEEDIATFKYYITELDKMGIAYIQLVRYLEVMDPEYEGEWSGVD